MDLLLVPSIISAKIQEQTQWRQSNTCDRPVSDFRVGEAGDEPVPRFANTGTASMGATPGTRFPRKGSLPRAAALA